MSQVPKNRKHSARATAMLPSHSRHGEPQGRWGSRAGHGWAAPAPRTRFLEWRQERRECSGDVNADIHGPCQARSRHGCSQQLTWGRSRGGGGGKGPQRWLGAMAQRPLPLCLRSSSKAARRVLQRPRRDASPTSCPGRVCPGGAAREKFPQRWHGCCPAQGKPLFPGADVVRGDRDGVSRSAAEPRLDQPRPCNRWNPRSNLVLIGATLNFTLLLCAVGWSPTAKKPPRG